jgi:hypothetical protein
VPPESAGPRGVQMESRGEPVLVPQVLGTPTAVHGVAPDLAPATGELARITQIAAGVAQNREQTDNMLSIIRVIFRGIVGVLAVIFAGLAVVIAAAHLPTPIHGPAPTHGPTPAYRSPTALIATPLGLIGIVAAIRRLWKRWRQPKPPG